jgi:glutamate--cysteine ligase
MSSPASNSEHIPVQSKDELIAYVAGGARAKADWKIGTEHEKFGFDRQTLRPLPYEGPRGIQAMLKGLTRFGWEEVREAGNVIALKRDGGSITLEPAGQFELSGAQLSNIHETCKETTQHLQEVKTVSDELDVGFLGMGFQPKWAQSEMPWMPKGRYKIMREYMPKRGNLGLDMMTRTCTVQVNLDFASEADMAKKFAVSLALQPIATALFADSPFTEGKPNGFVSFRSNVWSDTDPDRTGLLPFVFEPGFGFERYVDYLLDVPMYFVYRNGKYIDAAGLDFKDFMAGKLSVLPGEKPTLADFSDHFTTAFPEVRLKRYLEMRGADGGPWSRLCALPALWVGLLYEQSALDAAWDLVKHWSLEQREQLRRDTPRLGFKASVAGRSVLDVAKDTLAIAAEGLRLRASKNSIGADERIFLDPLIEFTDAGMTPADRKLALYHGAWKGSVDPVFREFAY